MRYDARGIRISWGVNTIPRSPISRKKLTTSKGKKKSTGLTHYSKEEKSSEKGLRLTQASPLIGGIAPGREIEATPAY